MAVPARDGAVLALLSIVAMQYVGACDFGKNGGLGANAVLKMAYNFV
tara:strand:- start:5736 stop:5876 length:141 start_codon:yes stop_codon:yes gene_type:complete